MLDWVLSGCELEALKGWLAENKNRGNEKKQSRNVDSKDVFSELRPVCSVI